MKISRIFLEGMIGIYGGLGLHVLDIDLSRQKNKIILICGRNGGGKSAFMQHLHPFANPTTASEGRKSFLNYEYTGQHRKWLQIVCDKTKDVYTIEHLYFVDKPTRSYIDKNGEQLNPNGGSGTFENVLEKELDLGREFLKLGRIGEGIDGPIDMNASARKTFMNKILPDVDKWLKFYKRTMVAFRKIESELKVLGHMLDRIESIGVLNERKTTIDQRILQNRDAQKRASETIGGIKSKLNDLEQTLAEYNTDANQDTVTNYESLKSRNQKINDEITAIESQLPESTTRDDLLKKQSRLESQIEQLNVETARYRREEVEYRNKASILKTELQRSNTEGYSTDQLRSQLKSIYQEIHTTQSELTSYYRLLTYNDPLVKVSRSLSHIGSMLNVLRVTSSEIKNNYGLSRIFAVPGQSRKNLNNCFQHASNVTNQINARLQTLCVEVSKCNAPGCCSSKCQHYEQAQKAEEVSSEVLRLRECQSQWSEYKNNLEMFVRSQDASTEFSKHLNSALARYKPQPFDLLALNLYYLGDNRVSSLAKFYYFDKLDIESYIERLSFHEGYIQNGYRYIELIERERNTVENLKQLQHAETASENTLRSLRSNIQTFEHKITELEKDIETAKTNVSNKSFELEHIKNHVDNHETRELLIRERDALEKDIQRAQNNYDKTISIRKKMQELNLEMQKLNRVFTVAETQLRDLETQQTETARDLENRKTYSENLEKTKTEFELIKRLKKVLDPTKGIPVWLTNDFLSRVEPPINQLLQIGTQSVDNDFALKFNVTDTEFGILMASTRQPTLNTDALPDVADVSSSEKSICRIGFGLGMVENVLKPRYNTICTDEVDGYFDASYRRAFIEMLGYQLDAMRCDQAFVISHNREFDNIPVDVILFHDHGVENFKNKNIIWSIYDGNHRN